MAPCIHHSFVLSLQIHKIMAGLLDQYIFRESALALTMVTDSADFWYHWVENQIAAQGLPHWVLMLDNEFGGMAEVLYNLYFYTKDSRHLR